MNKRSIIFGLLTVCALIMCTSLGAQPPLSGTTGPPCFPPPCIPIDGGTTLLIAAGLIWGGKKVYDQSKVQIILPKKKPFIRFLAIASILFIFWYVLLEFFIHDGTELNIWLIENLIDVSGWILTGLGYTLIAEPPADVIIRTIGVEGTTGVWVGDPCNGLEIMGIFVIFMLAIPGTLKHKLWYIPFGLICIHLLNAIRIAILAWVVTKDYAYLDFNHDYTFKIVVYSFIFILWMIWVKKFGPKKAVS